MAPIWYRVRSELRAHRARSLSILLVVAAVGGLTLTLVAGVFRTLSTPERYTEAHGLTYDVTLEQFSGRPRGDEVAGLPAVAAVDIAAFVFGGVTRDGSEPVEALVFAGPHRAFGARINEGRASNPEAPGEFVATRSWLTVAEAQLGDEFQVVTIS